MSKHSHTWPFLITLFEAEQAVQMYLCQWYGYTNITDLQRCRFNFGFTIWLFPFGGKCIWCCTFACKSKIWNIINTKGKFYLFISIVFYSEFSVYYNSWGAKVGCIWAAGCRFMSELSFLLFFCKFFHFFVTAKVKGFDCS